MKFEYDGAKEKCECVAVISCDALCFKTDEGCTYLYTDDSPNHGSHEDWGRELSAASRRFYPGDKITITF